MGHDGVTNDHSCTNAISAHLHQDVVTQKLQDELAGQRIAGPFTEKPFPEFTISPLGLVEKHEPNTFRLIHNLSYPRGKSVNDGIPKDRSTVKYASIGDAIEIIQNMGPVVYLSKMDIQSAFRLAPIHPNDYPLLGFMWDNQFYYDRCLPMGCSSSCAIFEKISSALKWIAERKMRGVQIVKLLDDFLFITNSEQEECADMNLVRSLCREIDIPLAERNSMGPARVLPFLGITLDTIKMEARLPLDKLKKCRSEIQNLLQKSSVRLRHLQSVLGLLSWACSVVLPGRSFLRRLFDTTTKATLPHHHVRLTLGNK